MDNSLKFKDFKLSRAFNTQGYFFLYHFVFITILIINISAYLGKSSNLNQIFGLSVFVFFMVLLSSLNFGFKKINSIILKNEEIEIITMNILFQKKSERVSRKDLVKIEKYSILASRGIFLILKNGKKIKLNLETFWPGDEISPARFINDYYVESELKTEIESDIKNKYDDSLSFYLFEILNTMNN